MKRIIFLVPLISGLLLAAIAVPHYLPQAGKGSNVDRETAGNCISQAKFDIAEAKDAFPSAEFVPEMVSLAENDLALANDYFSGENYSAAQNVAERSSKEARTACEIAHTFASLQEAKNDIDNLVKPGSALEKYCRIKLSEAQEFFDMRNYAASRKSTDELRSSLKCSPVRLHISVCDIAEAAEASKLSKEEIKELMESDTEVVFDLRPPKKSPLLTGVRPTTGFQGEPVPAEQVVQPLPEVSAKDEIVENKAITVYTVRRGDCLWIISGYPQIYDTPWQWPIIYHANQEQIKDPDLIFPRQVFDIPRSVTAVLAEAAHLEASQTYYEPTDGPRREKSRAVAGHRPAKTGATVVTAVKKPEAQAKPEGLNQVQAQKFLLPRPEFFLMVLGIVFLLALCVLAVIIVSHVSQQDSA